MANRFLYPFQPVSSTEIGFNSSAAVRALESTARFWQYPTSRAVQVASIAGDDFYINFGSSLVVASASAGMLCLGGAERVYGVDTGDTYIAIASSTDVTVNIALGHGG